MELNTAMNLGQILSQSLRETQIRLDIAPNIGHTRYDTFLGNNGYTETSAGLKTKLTALFPDQTTKGSIFIDARTGNMYTVGAELAKKFGFGE